MSTQAAPHNSGPPYELRRVLLRLVWYTMRFAIYGPLVGYLVMWFFFSILMFPWNAGRMGTEQAFAMIFQSLFGFFILIIPVVVAYATAIGPAAFTGLIAGALSLATSNRAVYYAGTAAAGFISTFAQVQHFRSTFGAGTMIAGLEWPLLGATAGLICAWFALRGMNRRPKIYGIPVTL